MPNITVKARSSENQKEGSSVSFLGGIIYSGNGKIVSTITDMNTTFGERFNFKSDSDTKDFSIRILGHSQDLVVADGLSYFHVPSFLNGYTIVNLDASVDTASSSGNISLQIYSIDDSSDILTTPITIEAENLDSYDSEVDSVIDTTKNSFITGNVFRIDCNGAGTDAKGLVLHISCR